jgi:hypothetical protein
VHFSISINRSKKLQSILKCKNNLHTLNMQTEQYKVFNMYTKQNTSQDEIQTVRRTLNTTRVLVQEQHTSKDHEVVTFDGGGGGRQPN